MAASIEDVSYELGGVLGVTLLGGLMTAVYSHSTALPAELPVSDLAYDSIDEACGWRPGWRPIARSS